MVQDLTPTEEELGFYGALDEMAKQETAPGGGYVGKVEVEIGFKVFVSGASNEESFFAFDVRKPNTKDEALANARAFLNEHAVTDRNPQASVNFILERDTVLNRDVSHWQGDRHFTEPVWTDNYKEVIRPKMQEAGVKGPGSYWAQITFLADVGGRMQKDQPDKPALFAYINRTFRNKGDAQRFASEMGVGAEDEQSNGLVPDGYTATAWEQNKDAVIEDLKKESISKVASDWDVDEGFLKQFAEAEGIALS